MRRLTRNVSTLALGMMLLGALAVAANAETTSGQANSTTVWKHRVLKRGSSQAPHQQANWSPHRTGDFGAKIHNVSTGESAPIMTEEMPLDMGQPVFGDDCASCGTGHVLWLLFVMRAGNGLWLHGLW